MGSYDHILVAKIKLEIERKGNIKLPFLFCMNSLKNSNSTNRTTITESLDYTN